MKKENTKPSLGQFLKDNSVCIIVTILAAAACIIASFLFEKKSSEQKTKISIQKSTSENTLQASCANLSSECSSNEVQDSEETDSDNSQEESSEIVQADESVPSDVAFPLDVNKATFDELILIDGVGEVTAQSIIDYRASIGTITSIDQLAEIDGIGEKTVDKLKNYLAVY